MRRLSLQNCHKLLSTRQADIAATEYHFQPTGTAIVMQTSRNASTGTCFRGLPIRALPVGGKVRCSLRGVDGDAKHSRNTLAEGHRLARWIRDMPSKPASHG
jgi:hypothetical protein